MKFRTYVLFFLLFGVLADIILCLTFLKAPLWRIAACLPTLAAGFCLPLIDTGKHYAQSLRVFSYLIFIFELPKFLTALIGMAGDPVELDPVPAEGPSSEWLDAQTAKIQAAVATLEI